MELVTMNNGALANTGITLEMFDRWRAFIDGSPRTVDTYTKAVRQFFHYMQENHISRPAREDVISYREYLLTDHKPTTVQLYLVGVKQFFKWLASMGEYPNIADKVKGAKLDRKHFKKDYIPSKQVARLLESIDRDNLKGLRDYAILSLMVTTGLRTISVINANIEDIRPAGEQMALYYQGKGYNDKAVYVKLADPVYKAIVEYLKARGERSPQAPLFTSRSNRNEGGRMTTRSISRLCKEALLNVGLNSDRLTAHSFRHTAGTLNLLLGGSLLETQQMLNHSDVNTTMIYVHAIERAKNNSENRIAGAIFG